jgi:hypothetical protein
VKRVARETEFAAETWVDRDTTVKTVDRETKIAPGMEFARETAAEIVPMKTNWAVERWDSG